MSMDVQRYAAPEVLGGAENVGQPADVYSLSVVVAEVLSGEVPFAAQSTLEDLRAAVCVRQERPTIPEDMFNELEKAWHPEPSKRLAVDTLHVMLFDLEDSDDEEDERERVRVAEIVRRSSLRRVSVPKADQPSWVQPAQDSPAPQAVQKIRSARDDNVAARMANMSPMGNLDDSSMLSSLDGSLVDYQGTRMSSEVPLSLHAMPPPGALPAMPPTPAKPESNETEAVQETEDGAAAREPEVSAEALTAAAAEAAVSRAMLDATKTVEDVTTRRLSFDAFGGAVPRPEAPLDHSLAEIGSLGSEEGDGESDDRPALAVDDQPGLADEAAASSLREDQLTPAGDNQPYTVDDQTLDTHAHGEKEDAAAAPLPAILEVPEAELAATTTADAKAVLPEAQAAEAAPSTRTEAPASAAPKVEEEDDDLDFFALLKKTKEQQIEQEMSWKPEDEIDDNIDDAGVRGPERWALHFNYVLASEEAMEYFVPFMRDIFCEENAVFWQETQSVKTLPEADVPSAVKKIYDRFLGDHPTFPINIEHASRKPIEDAVASGQPRRDCFVRAQREIYFLMKLDTYPKFLASKHYKRALKRWKKKGGAASPSKAAPAEASAGLHGSTPGSKRASMSATEKQQADQDKRGGGRKTSRRIKDFFSGRKRKNSKGCVDPRGGCAPLTKVDDSPCTPAFLLLLLLFTTRIRPLHS
jgi:hypothetical protein